MKLTDTQLTLLNLIDTDTFCDLTTELDFGRDEIFDHIFEARQQQDSLFVPMFIRFVTANIINPDVRWLITTFFMGPQSRLTKSQKALYDHYRQRELANIKGR